MRPPDGFLQSLGFSLAATGFVGAFLTPLSLAIPMSVIFFLVSMSTLSVLFSPSSMNRLGVLRLNVLEPWMAGTYAIAGLATVAIIVVPILPTDPSSLVGSLIAGGIPSVFRCTLAIYMTGFFPGYVMVNSFWKEEQSAYVRVLLSIIFSIVITSLIGAALVSLGFFSTFSALSLLWIVVCLSSVVTSRSLLSSKTERFEARSYQWSTSALFLVSTCLYLVIPSYMISAFRSPVSGIMSGDVNTYALFASDFLNRAIPFEAPYVGFTPYLLTVSALTGLPFGYAWVASQFILLSIPLSVYFISRTLMKCETGSMFAVLCVVIIQGISGIIMLQIALVDPTIWTQYLEGNSYGVISEYLYPTVGWGFATLPIGLGLMTGWIEIALLLTALTLGIKYAKSGTFKNGLVSGLIAAYMLLFHNIFLVTLYIAIMFLFSALRGYRLVRAAKLSVLFILIVIPMDLFSRQWFTYYILSRLPLLPIASIIVGTCILLLVLIGLTRTESREIQTMLSIQERLRKSCLRSRIVRAHAYLFRRLQHIGLRARVFLATLLFLSVVVEVIIEFDVFHIVDAWTNINYVYPWWVFMTRYVFQMAIIIVLAPYILQGRRCSSDIRAISVSWIVASIPLSLAPLFAPSLLVPSVWTNRLLMLLIIPLSFIAADGLAAFTQLCDSAIFSAGAMRRYSNIRRRNLAALVLVGMIAFSASTYSLAVQFRAGNPDTSMILSSEAASWIENQSKDLPVLTVSEATQRQLAAVSTSNLVSSTKRLTYSLTLQEALRSMPATELEILGRALGSFYVYLPYCDTHLVYNTSFEHWISEQQLAYEDSSGKAYRVISQDAKPEVGLWPIGNGFNLIRNITTVEHVATTANASSEEAYFWIRIFNGESATLNLTPIYVRSSNQPSNENESSGLCGWSGVADTLEIIGRDVEYGGHLIVINGLLEIPFPMTGNSESKSLKIAIPAIAGNLSWNSSYVISYAGQSLAGKSIEIRSVGEYLIVISEQYTSSRLPVWQLESLTTTGVRIDGPYPIGGCYSWVVETEHDISLTFRTPTGEIAASLMAATLILTIAALAAVFSLLSAERRKYYISNHPRL